MTLKQIVKELDDAGYQTSTSSLDRFLKKAKITTKVFLPIPRCWNSKEVIETRTEYVEQLFILSHGREVIYIDESGFHLSQMRKSRGRSVAGSSCVLTVFSPSQRVNSIVAMSKKRVEHTRYVVYPEQKKKLWR